MNEQKPKKAKKPEVTASAPESVIEPAQPELALEPADTTKPVLAPTAVVEAPVVEAAPVAPAVAVPVATVHEAALVTLADSADDDKGALQVHLRECIEKAQARRSTQRDNSLIMREDKLINALSIVLASLRQLNLDR